MNSQDRGSAAEHDPALAIFLDGSLEHRLGKLRVGRRGDHPGAFGCDDLDNEVSVRTVLTIGRSSGVSLSSAHAAKAGGAPRREMIVALTSDMPVTFHLPTQGFRRMGIERWRRLS